jgi:hypothetical protein
MPPSITDNPEAFFEELNKPQKEETAVPLSPVATPVADTADSQLENPLTGSVEPVKEKPSVADDPEAFFAGLTRPLEQKEETPQSVVLNQLAGKTGAEMDDFDMKSLDLLSPKELEEVTNQRRDIPLSENLLRTKFDYEMSLPWNEGINKLEDWKKIGQEVFGGGVSFLKGAQKFAEQSLFSEAEQDPSGWGHPSFKPVKDYVSGIASLPESAAYLFTKLKEGGMGVADRLSESIGVQDREKSYENYKARNLVDRIQAQETQENPSIYSRILKGDMANDALSYVVLNTLPDRETLMAQEGLTAEQADNKRKEIANAIARQTTSDIASREKPADEDIATFATFTAPAGLALGEMGLVSLGLEAGMGLTPKIAQGIKYLGKTDQEIKAMNDAAQALQKEQALQGLEKAQRPSMLGRAAGALATGIENTGAAFAKIGEATPNILKELAPPAIGAVVAGDERRGEGAIVGALLGKAGKPALAALKYAAKTPALIRDIEEARVLAAGGSKGTFETLASFPEVSENTAKILRFGGRRLDNTLNNVVEYAKAGVNPTLIALGTGALDSASPEELNKLTSTGLLYGLGGRVVHQAWGKITGVDPVIDARNRRQQDIDDLKTYRDLDPETRKTLDSVTSWDNIVERHTQRAANAEQAYNDAVALGKKDAEQLGKVAQAEKNVLSAVTRANVQTRDENSRQFVTQLTKLNQLVNGTLRAGQNNVGINILTPEQIVAKFRSDPANATATDQEILNVASQRGFYSTPEGAVEYQAGMGMDAPKKKLVFDRTKPSVVINADSLKARTTIEGSTPIDALNHEVGHHVRNIPEFREVNKDAEDLLFSQEVRDPAGNVVAVTAGQYSGKDLVDMYLNDYLKGKTPEQVTQISQLAGLWDYSRGALNEGAVSEYMKDEIISELNSETFSTHLGKGLDDGVLHMIDVARLKTKKNLLDRAVQKFFGLGGKGEATSELTGATFSPEVLAANRQAMRALQSLQGEVSQAVTSVESPKISRSEIIKNKAIRERFAKYAGLFKTKMQGQVFDGNGTPIGAPIDIANPNASEGSWESRNGETKQLNGYGSRPDEVAETAGVVIPDGGRLVVQKQIVTQPDGVTPVMMTPKEAKDLQKNRAEVIRQSLNTPDEGAPNRFEAVADESETWRGTFTPLQIQAIKDMPEGIIPKSIKENALKVNDMIVKGDGGRILVDYAAVMNDAGKYVAFSPKIYDVVPIGMHLSKAGNFLVTTISVGRMFDKLNAWSERMPARLAPWGGSKNAFFKEFTEKYLQNWQNGLAGETGLSGNNAEALAKKDIFNDFLNLTTNDFRGANMDRTTTPRRRGDVRGKDVDRTIMSMRLDHMAEIMDNENAPKVPIDYGKAIKNFLPAEGTEQAPAQEERNKSSIYYHGTTRNEGEEGKLNSLGLIFVSPDKKEASMYSQAKGGRVLETDITGKNIFDAENQEDLSAIGATDEDRLWDSRYIENEDWVKKIKDAGYDGFSVQDVSVGGVYGVTRGAKNIALFATPEFIPAQEERRPVENALGITATYSPESRPLGAQYVIPSGAELTASLVASGTSLESFGKDTLIQLAESYGIEIPKEAKRGEIIDAINERPIQAPVAAQPQETKFSFTTSTERDDAIKKMIDAGDDQGIRDLNRTTILSALADLKNIQVAIEDAKGVYKGDKEVSSIIKVTTTNQQDLNRVRSRIADAAKMFQQMEFLEEKMGAGKRSLFGETDEDGFKHMGRSTLYVEGVTEDQIEEARKQAGIDGLTLADGRIELYDRSDDPEFFNRVTTLDTAIRQAGGVVTSSETGVASVKSYSEDPQQYAGTIGYDDESLHLYSASGEQERLRTPLVQKLMGLMGRPMEAPEGGKRSYFEAKDVTPEQVKKQAGISQRFADLPLNDLANPLVQKSYDRLNAEILKQYDYLTAGNDGTKFTSQSFDVDGEPYANSGEAIDDIRTKNSLKFLKTDPNTFGPEGQDFSYHPLLQDSGRTDANGVRLVYNDLFRAVHDAIAHGLFGAEFGPVGEESAWQTHMRTLDDPWARWALTTETRGQNSYVNYREQMIGKDGMPLNKGDDGYIPLKERGFAEQKAALLPLEDSLTGDKKVDEVTRKLMKELGEDQSKGSAIDISFMPSSKLDEAYAKAIESGDMEEAQKLVDERARQAGYGSDLLHHGTTHDFTVFSTERSNVENDMGKGFYFSSNPSDVEGNYAGEGPDLTSRIERLKDQLTDSGEIEAELDEKIKNGELPVYTSLPDYVEEIARQRLHGGNEKTLKTYVRLENPAIIGGEDETKLEYTFDEDTEEETGSAIQFIEAIRDVVGRFEDTDADKAIASITEDGDLDGMGLSDAIQKLKESEGIQYASDENGDSAVGEVIRQILEEVGFDGIIDNTVNKKFGSERRQGVQMSGMDSDTYHVIAFDPNQIKSADPATYDNEGNLIPLSKRFDLSKQDIRFMPYSPELPKTEDEDPKYIIPPNPIEKERKGEIAVMANAMKINGWSGRPLLVADDQALTGSHRLEAAKQAGILVPIVRISNQAIEDFNDWLLTNPENTWSIDINNWFNQDDESKLHDLKRAKEDGVDDLDSAINLMQKEVDNNNMPKTEDGKIDWEGFKTKTLEIAKPLAGLSPIGGVSFMPAKKQETGKLVDTGDETSLPIFQKTKNGKPVLKKGDPVYMQEKYNLVNAPAITEYNGPAAEDAAPFDFDSLAYDVTGPQQIKINSAIKSGAVDYLANQVVEKTNIALENAEIAAGKGWYSRMRDNLLNALGEDGRELLSQLLGATSAKTPVNQNFLQAMDAYEGMNDGRYDENRKSYLEMLAATENGNINEIIEERGYVGSIKEMANELSTGARKLSGKKKEAALGAAKDLRDLIAIKPENRTPKQSQKIMMLATRMMPMRSNGKKFNANSLAVLKVIGGTWLANRKSPKTPNFAGNLSGRTIQATIDVWAARFLRQAMYEGYGKPWRIQPKSETGVSNEDFALGQIILERAANKLGMNPDDLQAVLWFAEKQNWDERGWTKNEGAEKSSFDEIFHVFFPKGKKPLSFTEASKTFAEMKSEEIEDEEAIEEDEE